MIWDVRQYQWKTMYQQAQEYYNEHGDLSINPKLNKKLYQWLKIQRKLYIEDGNLTEKQKELLSIIEIERKGKKDIDIETKVKTKKSPSRNDIWESMYEQAQKYFEQHGDLLVPRTEEYKKLSSWIKTQRRKYKTNNEKSNLSQEQIKRLEKIGMVWDVIQHQWDTMYEQAKAYYEQYGSLSISDDRATEFKQLRSWIQEQKLKYNGEDKIDLSKKQIEQLESICIIWDVNQTYYDNMYQQAKAYFEQHGDLLVPRKEEYKQLNTWIKTQRRKYKEKKGISQEEIKSLEAIGMVWDAKQHQWDTMYAQAKAYFEEHGNLSFPYNDKKYKQLSNWIQNKKSGYYGKGSCRLTEEQVRQLQAIGAIPYNSNKSEESLKELEDKLQSLVEKKKQTSQLVEDYEKLQEKISRDKGVEK